MLRNLLNRIQRSFGYDQAIAKALALPYGEISSTEAQALVRLAQGLLRPGPIVEIGTLFGWSTLLLAAAKDIQRPLLTVDNYSWNPLGVKPAIHRRVTQLRLRDAIENLNVQLVDSEKSAFYASYAGPPPAMVFLDADHGYEATAADISWAQHVGAGVICGHDYSPLFPGTVRAVDEQGGASALIQSLWVL